MPHVVDAELILLALLLYNACMSEYLYDTAAVARLCQVSRGRVRQWAANVRGQQRLKPVKRIGNALAFKPADVYRLRNQLRLHAQSNLAQSNLAQPTPEDD